MEASTISFASDPIWDFLVRFSINQFVLFILIWVIYHKFAKNRIYVFSFFQMGIMIFAICFLLKSVDIKIGVALGLFAVFGILRFRTENMPVKSMSYLFTIIGISALNAMANFHHPTRGFIVFNFLIVVSTFLLEVLVSKADVNKHRLTYKRLDLLSDEKRSELYEDISNTIGRRINQVNIRNIDIPKGQADLEVSFSEGENN